MVICYNIAQIIISILRIILNFLGVKKKKEVLEPFVFVVSGILDEFVFAENDEKILFGESETKGDFDDVPPFIQENRTVTLAENGPKVDNQKRGKSLEWIFVNE